MIKKLFLLTVLSYSVLVLPASAKNIASTVTQKIDDGSVIKCTDSDGGITPSIKGLVTVLIKKANVKTYVEKVTLEDVCEDNEITEYYCNNNAEVVSEKIMCPQGCDDGVCNKITCSENDIEHYYNYLLTCAKEKEGIIKYACFDNIAGIFSGCVDKPNTCKRPEQITCKLDLASQPKCSDSDFDSKNVDNSYYINGTITMAEKDGSKTIMPNMDTCADEKVLLEAYCDKNNFYRTKKYTCPNGCENGVCRPVTCDNISANKKGWQYLASCAKRTDYRNVACFNKQTGAYKGCFKEEDGSDGCTLKNKQAQPNIACKLDAKLICEDTELGVSEFVKGSLSLSLKDNAGKIIKKTNAEDYCSGKKLIESYCDGSSIKFKNFECKNGCSNGVCLESN